MNPITLTAEQAQIIEDALKYADTTEETDRQSKRRGDALVIIREALAKWKTTPDGRIPKTVFTIEDISKAAEMGRQAGRIEAIAEQSMSMVLNDPHPPHRLCECTACLEYWTPLPDCDAFAASGKQIDHSGDANEMVSRPQNCGTGHCSCIECVMEPATKEKACSDHPDAPHGFDRNASHNAGHYVCDCEGWTPEEIK